MEVWQRNHVIKHYGKLIEDTKCNARLLAELMSQAVLGKADIDKLKALKNSGEMDQSYELYDMLQSRTNGYQKIINVLYQCKQTGAMKILLEGFRLNGVSNPLEYCAIPIDYDGILESNVKFQNQEGSFRQVIKDIDKNDMMDIFKENPCENDYVEIFMAGEKKFLLAENTIPPKPSLYLPRFISSKHSLNPAIFKEGIQDIFVFKGIGRTELTNLAYPSLTSRSSIQILGLTSRFILLEKDVDWEEIKNLAMEKSCPVHLIKLEDTSVEEDAKNTSPTFILQGTVGTSTHLWQFAEKHIYPSRNDSSEEQFLKKIEENPYVSGFSICDTPGMGKSWLLANIARKIQEKYPDRIVAYISLSNFIHKARELTENFEATPEACLKIVLEYISPNTFSRSVLLKKIEKMSAPVEVFLDGLDEIPMEDLEWTKTFLSSLVNNRNKVRVYLTSRPHLQREIETTLGVISCDILPFTEENQLEFLVKTWIEALPDGDEEVLTTFATACMDNLNKTLKKQERDIMGIPLQCKMLAQIYIKEAGLYSNRGPNQEAPRFKAVTVHQMYKAFMEMRFSTDVLGAEQDDMELDSIMEMEKCYHIWKAMQLLYPEIAGEYGAQHHVNDGIPTYSHLKFGIMEMRHNASNASIEFVHRTYAEFLVSEYFSYILMSQLDGSCNHSEHTKAVLNTFFGDIMGTTITDVFSCTMGKVYEFDCFKFRNSVMTYFINGQISNKFCSSVDACVVNSFLTSVSSASLYKTLQSTLTLNLGNVFDYIKAVLSELEKPDSDEYKAYLMKKAIKTEFNQYELVEPVYLLLCSVANFCDASMVRTIWEMFQDCFQLHSSEITKAISKDPITPLHLALRSANYEITESLVDKINLENKALIYWCIDGSYLEAIDIVTRREDICQLLLLRSRNLITESADIRSCKYSGPLVADRVHPKLITYLIKEGADWHSVREFNREYVTVINCCVKYMSSIEYLELSRLLNELSDPQDIIKSDSQNLLHVLFSLKEDIKRGRPSNVLQGVNLNQIEDQHGDNLILLAVRFNQSIAVLTELIKSGADIKMKNRHSQSVLHLAAMNGNYEVIKYLIPKGVSIEDRDVMGRAPLHMALKNLKVLQHLLDNGANASISDNDGNTIAHAAAWNKYSENQYKELLVILLEYDPKGIIFGVTNKQGRTPLQEYLQEKDTVISIDFLKSLMSFSETSVNNLDIRGDNLLFSAIKGIKSLDVLKLLIDRGVDYRLQNKEGTTALHLAAESGRRDYVEYFLSLDIPTTIKNESKSPILFAGCNLTMIKSLVAMGEDIFATDSRGNSIVHIAATSSSDDEFHDLVNFIIGTYKITTFIKCNDDGMSPLQIRLHRGQSIRIDTLELFLSIPGTNVNATDLKGNNLFLLAVEGNQKTDVLDKLVICGSDYSMRNCIGKCALQLAVSSSNSNTVFFLICLDKQRNILNRKSALENLAACLMSIDDMTELISVKESAKLLEIFFTLAKHTVSSNQRSTDSVLSRHLSNFVSKKNFQKLIIELVQSYKSVNLTNLQDENGDCRTQFTEISLENVQGSQTQASDKCLRSSRNIKHGVGLLKALIETGLNMAGKDLDGMTLAHQIFRIANADQCHEIVQFLVEKGMRDVFKTASALGETPLHIAMYHLELHPQTLDLLSVSCNPTQDKLFSKSGSTAYVDFNATSMSGESILFYAIRRRSVRFMKTFIHHCISQAVIKFGDIVSANEYFTSVQNSDGNTFAHLLPTVLTPVQYHEIVEFLINMNLQRVFRIGNKNGLTPLDIGVIRLEILPKTMDIIFAALSPKNEFYDNKTLLTNDLLGSTILHQAALGKRSIGFIQHLVNRFLSFGEWSITSILKANNLGLTFMHLLARYCSAKEFHEIVDFLIKTDLGRMLRIADIDGETPLHVVVAHIDLLPETIDLLFRRHCPNTDRLENESEIGFYTDINAVDQDKHSILHLAVQHKRSIEFVQQLMLVGSSLINTKTGHVLQQRLDDSARNVNGETFLHIFPSTYSAEEYHQILVFLIHIQRESLFFVRDNNGMLPLHHAVYQLEVLPETLNVLAGEMDNNRLTDNVNSNYVDLNSVDLRGVSLLHFAVGGKRTVGFLKHCIRLCINQVGLENNDPCSDKPLSILKKNEEGNTFVHCLPTCYSAEKYHEIVMYLIEVGLGKSFRMENNNGVTPIHLAVYYIELLPKTLELLACYSNSKDAKLHSTNNNHSYANFNAVNVNGESILDWAIQAKRSLGLIKQLVQLALDSSLKQASSNSEQTNDVMTQNKQGYTFLHIMPHYYSPEEYHEFVEFLIERGLGKAFRIISNDKISPMHTAVCYLELLPKTLNILMRGDTEERELLKQPKKTSYVDLATTDINGESLVNWAIIGGRSFQFLSNLIVLHIDAGITSHFYRKNNEGESIGHLLPKFYSAQDYHNIVDFLIHKGLRNIFQVVDFRERTPLHHAIYCIDVLAETMDLFMISEHLQEGESTDEKQVIIKQDLNAVDNNGDSILTYAVTYSRSLGFVKHLVKLGCDWKIRSNHKSNLAHVSATCGLIEHLKYFVHLGCDINELDGDGDDVLQCGVHDASKNVLEIVEFLISKGAKKHNRNNNGKTALHFALEKGITDERILEALQ